MKKTFLILAAGIATTIISFSQIPSIKEAAAVAAPVATTGTTLPVARTLTSTDGRTIDATIFSKTATVIRAARADGKEFEIALDKLSDADRAFIAGLVEAPTRKLTAFLYYDDRFLTEKDKPSIGKKLEDAGFQVTCAGWNKEIDHDGIKMSENTLFMQKMTDDEFRKFDIIWVNSWNRSWRRNTASDSTAQADRLLKFLTDGKLVVWSSSYKTPKNRFIENKGGDYKGNKGYTSDKAYINIEGNTIFYNWTVQKWDSKNGSTPTVSSHPEILDQVILEVKKLILNPIISED